MAQVARNLTAMDDGFLHGMRYLILDLDSKFTAQFERVLCVFTHWFRSPTDLRSL